MYPNPVEQTLHVQLEHPDLPVTFYLIDKMGNTLLKRDKFTPGDLHQNLDWVPNGIYYIRIIQDDVIYGQELVVAH